MIKEIPSNGGMALVDVTQIEGVFSNTNVQGFKSQVVMRSGFWFYSTVEPKEVWKIAGIKFE